MNEFFATVNIIVESVRGNANYEITVLMRNTKESFFLILIGVSSSHNLKVTLHTEERKSKYNVHITNYLQANPIRSIVHSSLITIVHFIMQINAN